MDFTHCGELRVTISGEPFKHLLFHLVLSHSGWRYAEVCFGETFAALVKGLQGALWELGGVPRVVRTNNLSAATHELKNSRGRAMNANYEAILAHYGVEHTRTNRRSSHENGVVEQGHRRLKNAIAQALILRGIRDFESEDEYRKFVSGVVDRCNRLVTPKLETERRHLRPLPPAPVPEYVNYRLRVRKWSTIRVVNRTYSVPSRLIGVVVDVRLYSDRIEVYYKDHLVESMERLHGTGEAQIDYRHIIGSLVRKPGAFARYRFRKQMFPTHTFRLAYDALREWRGERADVEFVRILHLAAITMEIEVDRTLARLVESGRSVLFVPAYRLVPDMLAAKRDLELPRILRKLDNFDLLIIDDLGYLPQGAEESEVLFTLIAERYERRSLGITSNLVFSQWEKVFANPMATAAAIDRIVHHSVILEFDVPSYRTNPDPNLQIKEKSDRQK